MVKCRGCAFDLNLILLDLGVSPIANELVSKQDINKKVGLYPLKAMTCSNCGLVQLSESLARENLFSKNYVYYSSFSKSWLEHSKIYADKMIRELSLCQKDLVVEVASNDGYLLQYFKKNDIKVLGIEPALEVANTAKSIGIDTLVEFFDIKLADRLSKTQKPKLIIANNVLAHVPDLVNFIKSFSILIADDGLITLEFPHLMNLIKFNQFDTIYHEHYSYLSITALHPLIKSNSLKIVDIEKIQTHGGSLRLILAKENSKFSCSNEAESVMLEESTFDPRNTEIVDSFQKHVFDLKKEFIEELRECKRRGLRIAAYGAAAKGVTFLNFMGIDSGVIDYVVDMNPTKQNKYLSGSLIPIVDMEHFESFKPDVLLILAWNLSNEIKKQCEHMVRDGMKLLRAIPKLEYF